MTKPQLDKFKELAKEAECEPDEKKFDEQLKKIAKSPPPKEGNEKKDKPGK